MPAYPGHLTDYTTGMSDTRPLSVTFPDNSVIAYTRFLALKVSIYGDNLTFVGCLFEGTDPNDNLIQVYSPNNVAFRYISRIMGHTGTMEKYLGALAGKLGESATIEP